MKNENSEHSDRSTPIEHKPIVQKLLSNQELIDLAEADLIGALDTEQREAFDRSLAAAPEGVVAHVRHQQLLASEIRKFLPNVEPGTHLRQITLDGVDGAIAAHRAAPLLAGSLSGSAAGSMTPNLTPGLAPVRGVNPWWRASAIGATAALLLLSVVSVQLYSHFVKLDEAMRTNRVAEMFAAEFGPKFEHSLVSPQTRFVQFGAAEGVAARAVLMLDGQGKVAQLIASDLPANQVLKVQIIEADGVTMREVAEIAVSGSRVAQTLRELNLSDGQSVAITTRDGKIILRSIMI